jgi:hypothetical protein
LHSVIALYASYSDHDCTCLGSLCIITTKGIVSFG